MKTLSQPIKHSRLNAMLPGYFGDMIKAVADVREGILGHDAELHADNGAEMLSLTIAAQRGRHNLGEFCRLYEVQADCYHGDNTYQTDPAKLQRSFDVFYYANKQSIK